MHATVGLLKSVASLLYLVCPIHVDVHLYLMVYHFILFYLYCRYDVAPAHPTLRLAANLANPFGAVPAYPFGAVPTAVSANPLAVVSSSSENSSTETTLEVSAEPRHSRHSNLSLLSSLFSLLSLARALSRARSLSSLAYLVLSSISFSRHHSTLQSSVFVLFACCAPPGERHLLGSLFDTIAVQCLTFKTACPQY